MSEPVEVTQADRFAGDEFRFPSRHGVGGSCAPGAGAV